ncbi:MAG: sulfotransferase [Candidatus Aminicenantes bacterium]|nr:sulfotransferase [Candidatus Aminicenantes bacterium]
MKNKFFPIIIIGAPRSGTNMLRDIISSQPGFGTWPCDEINYTWRYGNSGFPDDELTPGKITPKIEKYTRKQFSNIARKYKVDYVVEKTCANCLRLEYVDALFPDALYVNIVRDGRDAASSALKRWEAPLDIPYLLKKVRFVPPGDLPFYAARYLKTHAHRLFFSKEKSLSIWGPKFAGYEDIVKTKSIIEVCGIQWLRCVEKSREVFEKRIAPRRCFQLKYENFVLHPVKQAAGMFDYFKLPYDKSILKAECKNVWPGSVGKWKKDLSPQQQELLSNLLKADPSGFRA